MGTRRNQRRLRCLRRKQSLILVEPHALWKDADPDTPILKEANAEYAKLQ